jgi:hypothetical protein
MFTKLFPGAGHGSKKHGNGLPQEVLIDYFRDPLQAENQSQVLP